MTTDPHQETDLERSLRAVKSELPSFAEVPADHDEIARRAYELYEARGREPGFEVDDWLRAEREVK